MHARRPRDPAKEEGVVTDTALESTYREACLAAAVVLVATPVVVLVPFDVSERSILDQMRRGHHVDPGVLIAVACMFVPALIGAVTLLATHRGLPHTWQRVVNTILALPFVGVPIFGTIVDMQKGRMPEKNPMAIAGLAIAALALVAFVRAFMGMPWKRFANLVAAPMLGACAVSCFLLQDSFFHRPRNLGVGAIIMWTIIGVVAPLAVWMTLPRRSKNA
jgi:hypothetical protein